MFRCATHGVLPQTLVDLPSMFFQCCEVSGGLCDVAWVEMKIESLLDTPVREMALVPR